MLAELDGEGWTTFVTLNHFTLPLWLHEPIAARDAFAGRGPERPVPAGFGAGGWLDPAIVAEFGKYAGYLAGSSATWSTSGPRSTSRWWSRSAAT